MTAFYILTGLLAVALLAWRYLGQPSTPADKPFRPDDRAARRMRFKAYYLHCLKKSPRRRGRRA